MRSKKEMLNDYNDYRTSNGVNGCSFEFLMMELLADIRGELAEHNKNYKRLAKGIEENREESAKVYDLKMQMKEVIDE